MQAHISIQDMLTHEHARPEHVSMQGTLACEHVSTQGTLACEHVFRMYGTQFSRFKNMILKCQMAHKKKNKQKL